MLPWRTGNRESQPSTHGEVGVRWDQLTFAIRLAAPSELLYSSQAPSVSLQHDLDSNTFEPFHSMAKIIGSRLHELLVKQVAAMQTEDIEMDSDSQVAKGQSSSPPYSQIC
jgi:hypothetical protein